MSARRILDVQAIRDRADAAYVLDGSIRTDLMEADVDALLTLVEDLERDRDVAVAALEGVEDLVSRARRAAL